MVINSSIPKYKILIVGDSNVGKTSVLTKFTDKTFETDILSTIGIDFVRKDITINKKTINLQIWDTAGQEKFRSITKSYYRGSKAIFVVFSLDSLESFYSIDNWIQNIREEVGNVLIVLLGNKLDNAEEFNSEMYDEKAKEHGLKIIYTSAKSGVGIEEAFMYVGKLLMESECKEESKAFKIGKFKIRKRKCC